MYDEALAARIRPLLAETGPFTERRMFGGVTFFIGGNMACGVHGAELMVRCGPAAHADALARPHARPMDLTGRPMGGWVTVAPEGLDDASLASWVALGAHFAATLPPKG